MKNQQEIINNIPQSEEWFLQTYARLKVLAGKSLNQVDFKEFTQLSTVIHDQKEVEQLIKTKMPADQLVGAAANLWKSLSGVKWLSELRKLISQSETKQIDMNRVKDLHERAQKVGINYEKEIQKKNIFERYFTQFSNLVNTIESFENKFGDKKKLIKTLEDLYVKSQDDQDIFEKFQDEVKSLNDVLKQYKIVSDGGEFRILEKLHTWIDFLRHYKSVQDQYQNNIPLDQVMLLSKQSIDKDIPDELNIKQFLTQRKNRFVKFTRQYDDYMRLRENLKKKKGHSIGENSRFSCKFIKQLIEECKSLSIEKDQAYNYDEKILEDDIKIYEQWRQDATDLLYQMEADDMSINDESLRDKFMKLQKRMRKMAIYDKESFIRVQGYNWIYQCLDLLETSKIDEPLALSKWENQVSLADQYTQYFKDIKSHSIFQRMLWEVQQAKEVIDFVNQQKINQKQWAAKFNLDKQQNYAYFRNKNPKVKIQKMLEIAKQSKVDLQEEIRTLDHWIKDYEKYTKIYNDNSFSNDMTLDKLKDIERIMYLSPIDYTEIYLRLKERIDTAEMIKLNLKKIFTEHETANALRMKDDEQPKRLKFSRIQYDLKLFKKSCNIIGIKEIEQAQEKVQQSNEKLDQIREKLLEIERLDPETTNQQVIRDKLEAAKKVFTEIEIDMENEEIDVRRMIFEAEMKLIFQNFSSNNRKLQYEEFKDLDKVYEKLRDHLQDETLHSKFKQIRYQVLELVRKINKLESESDLESIQKEADEECPVIDFTQLLTDKDARIKLGKRKTRDGEETKKPEQQTIDLTLNSKRRKKSDSSQGIGSQKSQKVEESDSEDGSSSSGDESGSSSSSEGSSSSSGSGSSNSSSSGSEDGSDSEEGSQSEEEESKTKTQNLARNRTRRNIVPNLDSDFIYENPAVKKIHQERQKQQEKAKPQQVEETKEVNLTSSQESAKKKKDKILKKQRRKERREQKRKEEEKKEQMRKQLAEFRLQQNKSQQTIQQRNQLSSKLDHDQVITFGSLISQDKALQDSLQIMKNKIREQTRHKLKEVIDQTEPVFSAMDLDSKKKLIFDLESEMFTKHPEVDSFYRKKCTDACENIKFLGGHKDIAEMVAIKKTMPYYRLFQPHPQFKDTIQNVLEDIKEKKRQERIKARQEQVQRKQQLQEEQKQKEADQASQQLFSTYDIVQMPTNRDLRASSEEPTQRVSGIKVSDSDDDDLESVGSNKALFSDDDEQLVPQSNNQIDPFTGRPYNQMPQYGGNQNQNQYGQTPQGYPSNIKKPIQFYNPYEVVDQINNRFIQNRSVQAIMFDPNYRQQSRAGQSQEKNIAPPGSLLKVWEGQIEISRDQQPHVQFFSTIDIKIFQTLPQLPQTLTLKGKSNISDVTSHFMRFKNDRKLIRGWITRRGNIGSLSQNNSQNTGNWQENSDKYTKLFDELEQQNKVALFNVFNGVTFYLVPITAKTKEFCKQMGIVPEQVTQKESTLGQDIIQDLEIELQEETHCYAVLSNIKQSFNNKLNFLNPDVLKMASISSQEQAIRQEEEKKGVDMSFSPITDDEEGNTKTQHKAQILQSVKQEEVVSQQNLKNDPNRIGSQPQVIVKSDENFNQPMRDQQQQVIAIKKSEDEEDDDDIDIDVVIEKMRAHENDIQQIQAELLPIIHRLKGEKEQKLTRYLEDLIQKYNNPPQQTQPPQIKQETIQTQVQQIPPQQFNQQQTMYQAQGGFVNQGNPQFGMPPQQDQRFQPQQQIPPFTSQQQMPGQFRQMPPSQQQFQQTMNQGQIRPQSMVGAVYPNQIPNMGMQGQQQVPPQFQQRQQMPPQNNPMFQPQGVPPLRPPPVGMPLQQQQMMRPGMNPQGMMPTQQQFMGQMNPRQMGMPPQQMPFNQQQQQVRQQYPHQQNQQQQQQQQRK